MPNTPQGPIGPPRSQFQDGRPGTLWWAVPGAIGVGWYVDTISVARPAPAPIKANPYDGNGLLAVLVQSGLTQEIRTKAELALVAAVGEAQRPQIEQANMYADPTWNASLYQAQDGVDADAVIAGMKAQGAPVAFEVFQLKAAVATAFALLENNIPSSPGYVRNYRHEDAVRDAKPGEVKKREARNAARHEALRKGLVHKGDNKEVDHIRPLSHGGSSKPSGSNIRIISAHLNDSYPRGHHGELLHQNSKLKGH